MQKTLLATVVALTLATFTFLTPAFASGKPIQVKGSDTMVNLGQAWAETFMQKTRIPVSVTGGGSGTGITALISGKTDIAEASRPMKPEEIHQAREKGVTPIELIVAQDGISVIVSPKNKVQKLTVAQLAGIYAGAIDNWKDVGGADGKIVVLGREVNSGTHVFFKEHIVQSKVYTAKNGGKVADYAKAMLMLPSNQAIHDEVASNVNAIGYIGLGYMTPKVHALSIAEAEGKPYVEPSVANVQNKTYPVSRPLYWYVNASAMKKNLNIKKFVDFALGAEGQKIVAELDFVPITPKKK